MPSIKETPQWKQYEWLITKIFHDNNSSLSVKVLHDTNLIGEYSEISRQIDVLIEENNTKTMIECKHYSKPVNIKELESFLSMFTDVQAKFGIFISSSGFTKSVYKRIREFDGRITLEHINWEKAYASFEKKSYGRITDLCDECKDKHIRGKEVPGLLCWEHGLGLEIDGIISMYSIGECLKCANKTVYCDPCGWITNINEESCCTFRDAFLKLYYTT
ncbi:MAG: restriction endonuclease [Epsilonproteobacteria bacterium]|nr:restriction endonuclease [Campylobacterota bacterium]